MGPQARQDLPSKSRTFFCDFGRSSKVALRWTVLLLRIGIVESEDRIRHPPIATHARADATLINHATITWRATGSRDATVVAFSFPGMGVFHGDASTPLG